MLTEKQIHFFWMRSGHLLNGLKTICGKTVYILNSGKLNQDQGQDFQHVKIKIDGQIWVGNVEIHLKTSDWFRHNHQLDTNYRNTILHVVWLHDSENFILSPILALSAYGFLVNYIKSNPKIFNPGQHFNAFYDFANENFYHNKSAWGLNRLNRKADELINELDGNQGKWEEVIWGQLAKTFGSRVNGMAFFSMAHSFPFWLLKLYQYDWLSLEALFMGQIGLLQKDSRDDFIIQLDQLYTQVKHKFKLKPIVYPLYLLRMRPNNFPAVRLSQLASFISAGQFSLHSIQKAEYWSVLKKSTSIEASEYWRNHLLPGKLTIPGKRMIGKQMILSVLINVYVPYLFALGKSLRRTSLMDQALGLLTQAPPEDNAITREWVSRGVTIQNAFDSQSLIEYIQVTEQQN